MSLLLSTISDFVIHYCSLDNNKNKHLINCKRFQSWGIPYTYTYKSIRLEWSFKTWGDLHQMLYSEPLTGLQMLLIFTPKAINTLFSSSTLIICHRCSVAGFQFCWITLMLAKHTVSGDTGKVLEGKPGLLLLLLLHDSVTQLLTDCFLVDFLSFIVLTYFQVRGWVATYMRGLITPLI